MFNEMQENYYGIEDRSYTTRLLKGTSIDKKIMVYD